MKCRVIWMLFIASAITGCMTKLDGYRPKTSGVIGCPVDELVITNFNWGLETDTWEVSCRGQTFYCSSDGGSKVNCAKGLQKDK